MTQLILHCIGDYVTQSQWMVENKTKSGFAASAHATVYSLPFLLIGSWQAFVAILLSHFLIDRFRLARFVVYAKNNLGMPANEYGKARWLWSNCSSTGYPSDVPPWMAVWLLIAADNTLHLICNYLALKFL